VGENVNTTPLWQSPVNGVEGDQNSVNSSSNVNQLLGTHNINTVYEGANIVTPFGGTRFTMVVPGNSTDYAQPFTMPAGKTSIGRITIPMSSFGTGSDVSVSLCNDNGSGSPVTTSPIASATIPASWISNLGDLTGLANSTKPLATARYNSRYATGSINSNAWAGPAGDGSGGAAQSASVFTSGNYTILAGGETSVPVGNITVVPYTGGNTIGLGVSNPTVPKGAFWSTVVTTQDSLVFAGGNDGTGSLTQVWVAGWDPNTGAVSSWSSQASLPRPIQQASGASFGNTVYMVGGYDSTGPSVLNTVYSATVNNGQLSSWNLVSSLPIFIHSPVVAVIGNWMIVAGGSTILFGTAVNNVYYAYINPDGSLNTWNTGPSLPVAMWAYAPGWDTAITDSSVSAVGGYTTSTTYTNAIQTLSVSPTDGPADQWITQQWREAGVELVASYNSGNDVWLMINPNIPQSKTYYTSLTPAPIMSIPLAATGLTPGNVYHVVFQQHRIPSPAVGTQYGFGDASPLPFNALQSSRHGGSWSTSFLGNTWSMLLSVYDGTASGEILHTWEDPTNTGNTADSNHATRTSTFVYNHAGLLTGDLESVQKPNNPLNLNSTFTSGVANWTPTNCTFVQSNAQVHGGFSFSGLMTPNGTSATVYVESNKGPTLTDIGPSNAPNWYLANGWVYSPTGYSSVSLSVNWYDSSNNFLSTSSNSVSVPAATWTYLTNYFQVPAGASQGTLVPTEGGTPSVSNVLYLSNITLAVSPEVTSYISPVSQITYPTTGAMWPPTGVVQIA
jgi:hypothetical protein